MTSHKDDFNGNVLNEFKRGNMAGTKAKKEMKINVVQDDGSLTSSGSLDENVWFNSRGGHDGPGAPSTLVNLSVFR